MSVVKRSLALCLALVMVVMTMGAVTLQTAYAATDGDISGLTVTYKADGKSLNVSFTVTDVTTANLIPNHVNPSNSQVAVDKSASAFEASATPDDTKVKSTTATGVDIKAKYDVQVNNLKPKTDGKGGLLQLTVNATGPDPGKVKYLRTIKIDIPDKESGGTTTPTPPPTPTESSAKYTVTKVRGTKRVDSADVPNNERVYFDIDNLTSSSDASIRQTYFADVTLRIFDENAPAGLTDTNIVGSGVSSMDMGSFYFDKRVSTVAIIDTVEGYYEVELTGLRYSGNGNKLTFRTRKGNYIGDVTAVVAECISKQDAAKEPSNDNDDDDDSKLEVETPYVIVSKYSYGGGSVTAGETFPLSLTIYNTSETEVVGNMMVTVAVPEGLMLTSSSNTFYVEELDKHASITKSMQVTAKVDAKPQSHTVDVSMKYQYVDDRVNSRRSAETTEKIAVPVVQVDRFQVTGVEIPMESMLGEEISLTVNFVNKGRSEAYNLSAEIDGNIQNPGQNQNLGNLASGVTGTADFFIQPTEVGMCTGEIKITYEDTNMEEKTSTIRYSTTVKSAEEYMGGGGMIVGGGGIGMPGEGEMPVEETKKPSWPLIAGICVVIAIPVIIIVKKKLDAKRKEREDADL